MTTATVEILDQGLNVLEKISDEDYCTSLPLVYGGTIGGHYRHVLEHFSTLLKCLEQPVVDYDLRERNESIENKRSAAIDATLELRKAWEKVEAAQFDLPIQLQGNISSSDSEKVSLQSSYGREAAYTIAHAHHHFAIIGVMCALLDNPQSNEFGVAPSTIKFKKSQTT